jgi:sensor histidine kinase YesM
MPFLVLLFISAAFIISPVASMGGARQEMPDQIVMVYGRPLFDTDAQGVLSQISKGQYDTIVNTRRFTPGSSVWIYIPNQALRADTSRNLLVTGYQDRIDLYKREADDWIKVRSTGKYAMPDEKGDTQRSFIQLFGRFPTTGSTAFLVVCHKQNNYCFSDLRADLVSLPELVAWLLAFKAAAGTFPKISLPFFGISITTVVLLLMKYALTGDRAYAFHAGGHTLFLLFFILLYFQYPVNIDNWPFKNPLLGVYLDKFFLFLSISCLLLSVRFFYPSGKFSALNNRVIARLAVASGIIAVLSPFGTHFTGRYYLVNNSCMIAATIIISLLTIHLIRIRSDIAGAFQIIVMGLITLIAFVFAGFAWVLLSYNRQQTGYEVQQAFPMLLGVGVSNLFIIAAFAKREHQIYQESIDLRAKAYEAEMAVVQKSLNPHFIFNCLNLIDSFLYANDCGSARKVLFDFSDLLRLVIEKSPKRLIPLSEELSILELYVQLERSRSDQWIAFDISVSPMLDTSKLLVPPLIIQPIVENAIKHGILPKLGSEGKIQINLNYSADNMLHIRVEDDGIGLEATKISDLAGPGRRGHFGIPLTRKRLEIMGDAHNVKARIAITSKDDGSTGTIVDLILPLIATTNDADSLYY